MSNHVLIYAPHFHPPHVSAEAIVIILLVTLVPMALLVGVAILIERRARRMFSYDHRRWDRWWWF